MDSIILGDEDYWVNPENRMNESQEDRQSRNRQCGFKSHCKVAHLKPLESLCMDVICKNFTKTTKAEREAHLGLNDVLWNQLLPHFLGNSHDILNYFLNQSDELVEFLTLLFVSARHFDFRCVSRLKEANYEKVWEGLQKNENCLKSLIVLDSSTLNSLEVIEPKPLNEVPRQLEILCSLRSLKSLYLSVKHTLDEAALTSIGNNLLNLVSLNCTLAKEGIQKEAMDQFFSNLKHLKEFRCNSDFEHMKSLLEMNHKLQVAGIEASSKLLKKHETQQEAGHFTNGLQNPIPLEHLVLCKESLGEKQMKMLSSVKHLKLVGWPREKPMNDTLWNNLLDFKNLESLHFHNSNSIYLKFLEKFGPWLKGLSLVNVTYGTNGALPMDQILRMCPRLETLLIADGYNPKVQAGTLPLPPMKYLEKLAIVGGYSSKGHMQGTYIELAPSGPADRLLVHLLSSPELKEVYLESVSFHTRFHGGRKDVADTLEHLASSGKIFQKLEWCQGCNSEFAPALLHAPKFKGYHIDLLARFY